LRTLAIALAAALLAGLGVLTPAAAPAAFASANPKVAIIVGATHSTTPTYRSYADQLYAEAIKYTTNVVKVYSPNATWSKVKAAVNGASVIVYLGHGNGWPSPYTYDPNFTTKDGFGLNYDLNGDGKLSDNENKYYGEPKIETLTPAPNAVVLLFHLCYASGNSESSSDTPSLSVAKQRVDNFASAFLRAGARAVIANGHSHDPYYIRALFTTRETIDEYWRGAPDFHDNVSSYASTRTSGDTFQMDPEAPGKYYRSIAGDMSLRTQDVTGASYASTGGDPDAFVVPGNASPSVDGAPVYDSPTAAMTGGEPATTLPASARVRIEAQDIETAAEGASVFQIHTDDGVEGWMLASELVPRDSAAPRVWSVDDGTGTFSPNGDGSKDTLALSVRLSESSSWTLTIGAEAGARKQVASGSGDTATGTWAPAAGSVPDGTYTWTLAATDAWGNGPLDAHGTVVVDTQAPELTLGGPPADSIRTFTPNGDGSGDTIGFPVGSSEPGSVVATVSNASGTTVATTSVGVAGSAKTLAWDGRKTSGAYASDGRYSVTLEAVDLAGNASTAVERTVDVYGAMGFAASSRVAFFPQDGDRLAPATAFSFKLLRPATVTWTIVNAGGAVVRTVDSSQALGAGTYAFSWNGRADSGSYVPRGTYRAVVQATNGTQVATQSVSVLVDAFRIAVSDATPARGQRLTVTVTSTETLGANPRVAVYQPGIRVWRATAVKVSGHVYRVTIRLRSSATGTLRLRVYGKDKHGARQATNRYLTLH
jgi:flagellar hook assembly protein FlgD